jgi:hypothetical protein
LDLNGEASGMSPVGAVRRRTPCQRETEYPLDHPATREDVMKSAARIRFDALNAEWFTETTFQPSVARICMHPAFLDIVSMGETAVPFIIESLRQRPSFLIEALRRIVGSSPETSIGSNGKIQEAAAAWVRWYDGPQNGHGLFARPC